MFNTNFLLQAKLNTLLLLDELPPSKKKKKKNSILHCRVKIGKIAWSESVSVVDMEHGSNCMTVISYNMIHLIRNKFINMICLI
jgi:uncharacterized glyoxalase superfamily protein PhnB